MPVRLPRRRLPLLLIIIPATWLLIILFVSFKFESESKEHKHVYRSNAKGFLPSLVFDENGEINEKIKNSENNNPLELEEDVRKKFELEDQLELQQRENEMQLEHLMNMEAGIINKAELEKQMPVVYKKHRNPFLDRLKNKELKIDKGKFKGQIKGGDEVNGKLELLNPDGTEELGENGVPVFVEYKRLNEEEKEEYNMGMKTYQFNEFISNTISLQRTLPDIRNSACRSKQYSELPQVSIIITFYNEAWSTLLRTLYSAINRAPTDVIYEILLVDDNSNLDHLKTPLEEYLKANLPLVKLIRSDKRIGLIRARLKAVEQAKSGILVFLDSHIECFKGWLEPLIEPLLKNPQTIATPIIEMIDYKTFGLASSAGEGMIGALDLPTMTFDWSKAPRRILEMRKSPDDYYLSPTMAGGLFSIYKEYFKVLGGYDENLELWGSENLELSFKTWMCGGNIIINPCSHIGHIFRPHSPYLNNTHKEIIVKNKARVAEVWLDDYKNYFMQIEKVNQSIIGDVSVQKKIKSDLNCNDFDWYIRNIYPELYVPGVGPQFGEIVNDGTKFCLVAGRDKPKIKPCEDKSVHIWDSSRMNEIRFNDRCLDVDDNRVIMSRCTGEGTTQAFIYTKEGYIIHRMTELCLTSVIPGTYVVLQECIFTIMQGWGWSSNPNFRPL